MDCNEDFHRFLNIAPKPVSPRSILIFSKRDGIFIFLRSEAHLILWCTHKDTCANLGALHLLMISNINIYVITILLPEPTVSL